MAMTSVLSRVPSSVTRPVESALGSTRCFSECKGPVSVSVTRPMESNRGATVFLSVRKDRAQNHDCAADNNNMQIFGTWNRRRDCWKNYSFRWSEGMSEKSNNTADQSEQEDDADKWSEGMSEKSNNTADQSEQEDDADEIASVNQPVGDKSSTSLGNRFKKKVKNIITNIKGKWDRRVDNIIDRIDSM